MVGNELGKGGAKAPARRKKNGGLVRRNRKKANGLDPKPRKLRGTSDEPAYKTLQVFWDISSQTAYRWIDTGLPFSDLVAISREVIRRQRKGPARERAQGVLRRLAGGEDIEYFGRTWTIADLGEEDIPKPQAASDDVAAISLDALIEHLGKRMRIAVDSGKLDAVAEVQPLFLKAVESKDRSDLAAKKLGIDSLEIIPRPQFVRLLNIIAAMHAQRLDSVCELAARASAGLQSTGDCYVAIRDAIGETMTTGILDSLAGSAKRLDVPGWVIDEISKSREGIA